VEGTPLSERDDDQRLASGWGRREQKHAGHDWSGDDGSQRDPSEPPDDLEIAGDSGAITGRATSRTPDDLATGDTLGGVRDTDTADDTGPADEAEANLAQSEPLRDEPPRR
jgi:hypothetical protein